MDLNSFKYPQYIKLPFLLQILLKTQIDKFEAGKRNIWHLPWEILQLGLRSRANLSALGVQNPRLWEISRSSGDVFPNTSLLSAVYGYILEVG